MSAESPHPSGPRHIWRDLVLYSSVAFALGALFGLSIFFSQKGSSTDSVNWGSFPDWLAAFGGVLGAASTVAIALIARTELKRREDEQSELALVVATGPVCADMEMAVRISRLFHAEKSSPSMNKKTLVSLALSLEIAAELGDLSKVSGLPPEILQKLAISITRVKFLQTYARAVMSAIQCGDTLPDEVCENLVSKTERLATTLMPVADYLLKKVGSGSKRPWEGWSPSTDMSLMNDAIIQRYHST